MLIVALGFGLRGAQYLGRVDMWYDELALARNVEDRGLVALLTRPLDHRQVAPVGFLALLKVCSTIFGVSETGLRLGPSIISVAALILFWRVASRFSQGAPLLAALALFAVSPALVWYGSSLKPYGGDVAVSLLLVWLALRFLERPGGLRRSVLSAVLGGLALLMSLPAVPTAAVLAALLVAAWWARRPKLPLAPLASLGAGWFFGIAVAGWAAVALLDPETDDYMREFWAADFPPTYQPLAALTWGLARLYSTFAHALVFIPPENPLLRFIVTLPVGLAVVGLVFVLRRRSLPAVLLLAPAVAGLSAALVHLMPFDRRVALHATWPVLVLAAFGLTGLRQVLPGRWRLTTHALAVLMALPLVAIVLLASRPPYSAPGAVQPRPVLTDLAGQRRPADRIYVYTQGRHDMAFYGKRAGIEKWTQGRPHYGDPRRYLREIDALRGEPRVWFFWMRLDRDEPALIRSYLETIGHELARIPDEATGSTGAVLYDLSDPHRLGQTTAELFPLPTESDVEQ